MAATTRRTERCRSCGAPVVWLRHEATGRWAPIDAEPSATGSVALDADAGTYRVPPRDAVSPGPRHAPHFQTCRNAPAHRRPKAKAGGSTPPPASAGVMPITELDELADEGDLDGDDDGDYREARP